MSERRYNCLYVEDDPLSREVMHVLITQMMGYDLTIFPDSEQFMERVRALPVVPDIFFLDVHIAPLDGYAMLEALRNDPTYEQSTMIAMTASVMTFDVERLQQVGFHGLIAKPVRKRVFPELLARIMAGEQIWFTS